LVAIQIQKLIKHKAQTLALEKKKKTYFAHLPPKYEGQIKKKVATIQIQNYSNQVKTQTLATGQENTP